MSLAKESSLGQGDTSSQRERRADVCPSSIVSQDLPGRWEISKKDVLFLTVTTLLAALIRLDFLLATQFVIDADEAIVGLMANHIVQGREIPVFYYGQHYMGSLEAILVAGVFSLFGSSGWALQSVPYLFAVVITPLMFLLTREIGGRAAAHFAALLYAIPPAGLLVWSSKARGGFIEVLFLGALALLYACRWLRSERLEVPLILRIGFLLGVGWWVNNQIVYFMAPIGLFMMLKGVRDVFVPDRGDAHTVTVESRSTMFCALRYIYGAGVGLVAFLFGSAPYWIYNMQRGFPSLGMFGFASLADIAKQAGGLITTALPILLGSKRFWDAAPGLGLLSAGYLFVYGFLAALLVLWRGPAILRFLRAAVDRTRPIEMLVLFVLLSCTIFTSSTFGWLVQAPRYLLPVYVGLFPLCAVVIEWIGVTRRGVAVFLLLGLLGMNVIPAYLPTRALQGEPVVFKGERVEKNHNKLIARLKQLGISKIRTNYWIGYRLAFETNENLTFVVFQEPRTVRIPEYEERISAEARNELPLVVVPAEALMVRAALRRLGYSFSEERIGGYFLFFGVHRDDSNLTPVASRDITASSNTGTLSPQLVLDGDLSTRWGTGSHQIPGQELEFVFKESTRIAAVQIESGQWAHDYPRGLAIVGIDEQGNQIELLSPKDYSAVRYFAAENGEVRFAFAPTTIRRIVLRQTGSHGIFDWSVAEVSLFTVRADESGALTTRGSE